MSIRTQVFVKRVTFVARHNPHQAMMTLLAKGASFEFAARVVAGAAKVEQ